MDASSYPLQQDNPATSERTDAERPDPPGVSPFLRRLWLAEGHDPELIDRIAAIRSAPDVAP